MALLWIAVGSLKPVARMPFKIGVGSPKMANDTKPPLEVNSEAVQAHFDAPERGGAQSRL